jgi:hypothetical protein
MTTPMHIKVMAVIVTKPPLPPATTRITQYHQAHNYPHSNNSSHYLYINKNLTSGSDNENDAQSTNSHNYNKSNSPKKNTRGIKMLAKMITTTCATPK